MATGYLFDSFTEDVAEKKHNLGSDTLKIALSNTAPSASSDSAFSDITEISAGNGYTAGGITLASITSAQASGTYELDSASPTLTASGGDIGPFRYLVLYNDTATSDELIGYWDAGSPLTVADGQTVNINVNVNGLLRLVMAG